MKKYMQKMLSLLIVFVTILGNFVWFEMSTVKFDYNVFHDTLVLGPTSYYNGIIIMGIIFALIWGVFGNVLIASAVFSGLFVTLSQINFMKIADTTEPVTLADLKMIAHPIESIRLVEPSTLILPVVGIIGLVVVVLLFNKFVWKKYIQTEKFLSAKGTIIVRLVTILLALLALQFTVFNHNTKVSKAVFEAKNQYQSQWSILDLYKKGGSTLSFFSTVNINTVDKPKAYSKEKIQNIVKKYRKSANEINLSRSNETSNRKVLIYLSETLTNPKRFKGITIDGEPLETFLSFKETHTSGDMIAPGIGGGTSNTEWEILTGLNMANLSDNITTPYTQFFYGQSQPQTLLKYIAEHNSGDISNTVAIHATPPVFYRNSDVYKNIGLGEYYHLNNTKFDDKKRINGRLTDQAFFKEVINKLKDPENKTVIAQSMQNHTPYTEMIDGPDVFKVTGNYPQETLKDIQVYSQLVGNTSEELPKFIQDLENLEDDVTVLFYGDHTPKWAIPLMRDNPGLTAHKADFFVYSNHKAESEVDPETDIVASAPYMGNHLLKEMDLKISPYYAMLLELEKELPIILKSYVGSDDVKLTEKQYSKKQKELMEDYRLITYDILSGDMYSLTDGFYQQAG